MRNRELNAVGYGVWGMLAYGLTKSTEKILGWFGLHVSWLGEAALVVVMVVVAATLLDSLIMSASQKTDK